VLFDDSWPHAVINEAGEPRAVLIVDVPRPLPLLPQLVNHFVLWGLAAPLFGRRVARKAGHADGELF
jgi:aspartyl/asparaginyl beta-hydroxylase (cupin superfamily)